MPNEENISVSKVDVSNIINQDPPTPTDEEITNTPPADAGTPPADKPTETPPADAPAELTLGEKATVEAKTTGVEAFDTVGTMLAEKGVENTNEIMDAFLETGEISLEHKAAMIEALGEGVASMAFKQMEGAANTMIAEAKADSQKSMDYANTKFGGEDAAQTWEEIQAYVRTPEAGFSEADLEAMNTMLAAGGLQAQLVIDRIHSVYNADPSVSQPGVLLEGDTGTNGMTFTPISRADYIAEMDTAVRKYGEDSHQVRELDRRRTLSMKRGI